jgi:ABC-2 type transport system ATP-binding protein
MSESAILWDRAGYSVPHGFWMKPRVIIREMSLSLPQGKVLGLVGPNGAGKTTTIKLGAGLLKPGSGRVLIRGIPAMEPSARRELGLLTETQYIYPHLRLYEWLAMLGEFSGIRGPRLSQRIETVLDQFNLTERKSQMMNSLSKGQLQRAGLAQVFLHEPEILLLDEPMSGLDPYWRYQTQKILGEFKAAGGTILFSSHIIFDVERLCDQIVLLKDGALQWTGTLKEMTRKIKGYEAVCTVRDEQIIHQFSDGKAFRQPKGEWVLPVPVDQKNELLRLASEGVLELESLRPIQEEIEEVLFGVNSKSGEASS